MSWRRKLEKAAQKAEDRLRSILPAHERVPTGTLSGMSESRTLSTTSPNVWSAGDQGDVPKKPTAGERVFLCVHRPLFTHLHLFWNREPLTYIRPNKSEATGHWIGLCSKCFQFYVRFGTPSLRLNDDVVLTPEQVAGFEIERVS